MEYPVIKLTKPRGTNQGINGDWKDIIYDAEKSAGGHYGSFQPDTD